MPIVRRRYEIGKNLNYKNEARFPLFINWIYLTKIYRCTLRP